MDIQTLDWPRRARDLRRANSTLMSPTLIVIEDNWDGVERRRAERKLVTETVLLSLRGRITLQPCAVRDLTALGIGLNLKEIALLPVAFRLSFDGFKTSFACRLIWRELDRGGVEFLA